MRGPHIAVILAIFACFLPRLLRPLRIRQAAEFDYAGQTKFCRMCRLARRMVNQKTQHLVSCYMQEWGAMLIRIIILQMLVFASVSAANDMSIYNQSDAPLPQSPNSCVPEFVDSHCCFAAPANRRPLDRELKNIPIGRDWVLDVGGNYRARYHHEDNMRPGTTGGLSGVDDEFWLQQIRLRFDLRSDSNIKIRAEFIDAQSFGEQFRPRAREVNQHDLYQLYADVPIFADSGLTARLGRQEIKYGEGRLMMAPNWANRRRSHDGVRMMWNTEEWEANYFWVRPAIRSPASFTVFDETNPSQQLYGVYATYKRFERDKLELYWLAFDFNRGTAGNRFDTFGSRFYGGVDQWVYEFEGAAQFGTNGDDSSHLAGFCVLGVGRKSKLPWSPEAWLYYDWASGSDTVGNGFHHYVARGHYFMGFMDLFGRRNLEDINIKITAKPTEKLTLLVWYHYFRLANRNDVPYNLNMRPYAGLTAGSAGHRELGHELDLRANYRLAEKMQLQFGYSYFWAGKFYKTTAGVPSNREASFIYSRFLVNF